MKKLFALISALLLIILLAASFAVCNGANKPPITFAVLGPMTGTYAEFGQNANVAVNIACDEINAKGGLLGGRKVEVVTYDDQNIGEQAGAAAPLIIANKAVCAVASGCYSSGVALVACPVFQRAGLPSVSCSASHPDYSKIGDYIFRNNNTNEAEARNGLQVCAKEGIKRLGIMTMKSDFGVNVTQYIQKAAEEIKASGLEVVCVSSFVDGTVDFNPNVTQFEEAKCDGILVTAEYSSLAPFALQLRKVDQKTKLFSLAAAYSPQLLALGGQAVEGLSFNCGFNPESTDPRVQSFVKKFSAKLHYAPDVVGGQAYDNAYALFEAIKIARSDDRTAIKNALYKIDYKGVTGRVKFDSHGEATMKTQLMFTVKNGKFVEVPNALKVWDDFVKSVNKK
jgi:branched-chain amino acid transport system substrate-binding protein